jgi:hypothetical protein
MVLTASGNPTYELRHARCTDVQTWHDTHSPREPFPTHQGIWNRRVSEFPELENLHGHILHDGGIDQDDRVAVGSTFWVGALKVRGWVGKRKGVCTVTQ